MEGKNISFFDDEFTEPKRPKDSYRVIYQPRGAAREYSEMAVNLFKGCTNGCKYCYAPDCLQRPRDIFHSTNEPREGIVPKIARDLQDMEERGDRRPVLFCFVCDAYPEQDPNGMDWSVFTRSALTEFRIRNHPFQMLTKGGMRAARDFELYSGQDAFAVTLTLNNEKDSLEWEPRAALPASRIEALQAAKKRGITTWVSFEPVISPEQTFRLYEATKEFVDLYKIGKLNNYPNTTDWRRFGESIIERCERDGKPYYIKDALRAFLQKG